MTTAPHSPTGAAPVPPALAPRLSDRGGGVVSAPYYEDDLVTLYHGDCREVLPALEPAALLLTDPPYGIAKGAAVSRRNMTAVEDWTGLGHNAPVAVWRAGAQLLADAWIVEFGAQVHDGFALHGSHVEQGWAPSNMYALVKQAPAPTPRPGFASAIELGLVSRKGSPDWHGGGYTPNRWVGLTPNRTREDVGHPTQKPLEPFAALVRALCPPSGLVLDPFAGSGTTLLAAKNEGRRAIGVEIDERYCEIAARRLAQDTLFGEVTA